MSQQLDEFDLNENPYSYFIRKRRIVQYKIE